MRRVAVWLIVFSAAYVPAAAAPAAWLWRGDRWEYVEEPVPEPPARSEEAGRAERARPPIRATPHPQEAPEAKPAPAPTPEPPAAKTLPPAKPPQPAPRPRAEKKTPPETERKPKRPWYRPWGSPPDPDADRALFERGHQAYSAGRYGTAERAFKQLIKRFPTSEHRAEAMWLRGEACFAQNKNYKAFEQYEQLLEQYAGSPRYREALEREIEIAERYLGPARRRVLSMPVLSGETEAIEILRRVYEHQPTGDLAEACMMRIADYYRDKQRWQEAEDYYDKYCREYPNGRVVRYAELHRAKCAIERCHGPRYDTTSLKLALDRLRQYRKKYPKAAEEEDVPALIRQVREKQAQAVYEVAAYYVRARQPLAAAHYAERLQQRFPDTSWSEKGKELLTQMAPKKEQSSEPPESGPEAPERGS